VDITLQFYVRFWRLNAETFASLAFDCRQQARVGGEEADQAIAPTRTPAAPGFSARTGRGAALRRMDRHGRPTGIREPHSRLRCGRRILRTPGSRRGFTASGGADRFLVYFGGSSIPAGLERGEAENSVGKKGVDQMNDVLQ